MVFIDKLPTRGFNSRHLHHTKPSPASRGQGRAVPASLLTSLSSGTFLNAFQRQFQVL